MIDGTTHRNRLAAAGALVLLAAMSTTAADPTAPDFHCPFDGQTAAVMAAGTRAGTDENGLAFADGVVGQALTVGSRDGKRNRSVYYPVADLLDAKTGSVAFWVKPLDWNGGDAPFHIMLRAMAGDTYFLVYKYFNSENLLFLLGPFERWTSVRAGIGDWHPGQWHHVACAWSDAEIALWVDGRLRATERLRYPIPPFVNLEPLSVGPGKWVDGAAGTSLMDDLRVFRRVLGHAEIAALYRQGADAAGLSHETGLVTVGASHPTVDGAAGDDEYAFTGTGFLKSGAVLATRQGRYWLGYDDQRLCLAVRTPQSAGADERVEFLLAPGATRSPLYRIVVAPDGGVTATRDNDGRWDCAGLEVRQRVADGAWTVEVGLPFAAFGLAKPPEDQTWRFNLACVSRTPAETRNLAPVVGGPDDWSSFLTLRFRRDAPTLRLNSLVDVVARHYRADIAARGRETVTVVGTLISSTGRDYGDQTTRFTLLADGRATPYTTPAFPLAGRMSYRLTLSEKTGTTETPLYRGDCVFDPELPLTVRFAYTLHELSQLFLAAEGRGVGRVRVRFLRRDGTVAVEQSQPVPPNARFFNARFDLDFARLPPGDYLLRIDHLADDGQATGSFEQEYRVPDRKDAKFAPYVDPDADKVPAPWTPLESDATSVRMWGRAYDFGDGVLVSGLQSQGRQLLAAPARLRLNGKDLAAAAPPTIRRLSATDLRGEWERAADLGALRVSSRLTVHFDGYCEVALTLSPAPDQAASLQTLSLDFPFRGEAVRLVRDSFVSYGGKSGAVGEAWNQTLANLPMLWVGNEDVGFNWVAADLSQWHYRQAQKNVEIVRQGDQAILRFNLVDTPLTLAAPRTIEFGFVLTPSRPLDPRLRRYRTDKEWQMWVQPWKYFNYIDADQIEFAQMDAEAKGYPEAFLYMSHGFVAPFCPEWAYWEEPWRHTHRPYGEVTGNLQAPLRYRNAFCYAEACLQSESFRRFHLHQMDAFFRRGPVRPTVRNYYFDFAFGVGCDNAHHGCAPWTDLAGKPHSRVLNAQTREVTLATYRMIKRADPAAAISYHLGYPRDLPVQHFSEVLVVGEGAEPEIATRGSYYDLLTPETFRATYLPQAWGMKVVFINQLVRALVLNRQEKFAAYSLDDPETRQALLHLVGYLTVHDVEGWWAYHGKYQMALDTLWATQDRLGWDEATTFHPYWQPAAGVMRQAPASDRVMASAYSRRGKLLLAVLNDTDQPQDVTLGLDLGKLGIAAGATGRDAWQPEKTYRLGATWQDTLGPRGFRLVLWEPPAPGQPPAAP